MRPRVFPAENAHLGRGSPHVDPASMRPRVFPAENRYRRPLPQWSSWASMRPRVFPAENFATTATKALDEALQ